MNDQTHEELKLGIYRHFKGNTYKVVAIAQHSETLEPYVIYEAQYGDHKMWVRPLPMFTEIITRDGKTFPRFEFISE